MSLILPSKLRDALAGLAADEMRRADVSVGIGAIPNDLTADLKRLVASSTTNLKRKRVVVVMIPNVFAKQVTELQAVVQKLIHKRGVRALTVIWLAALGIRCWDVEDRLPRELTLKGEWLTPSEWEPDVDARRTVVQKWKWKGGAALPRPLWKNIVANDAPELRMRPLAGGALAKGSLIVASVQRATRVGAAGLYGTDVRFEGIKRRRPRSMLLTRNGVERVQASAPPAEDEEEEQEPMISLGTLEDGGSSGTAMVVEVLGGGFANEQATTDVSTLVDARRQHGVFRDMLRYRSSRGDRRVVLGVKTMRRLLATNWKQWARPIEFLDGVRRTPAQW